jgi:hypothetical protein
MIIHVFVRHEAIAPLASQQPAKPTIILHMHILPAIIKQVYQNKLTTN